MLDRFDQWVMEVGDNLPASGDYPRIDGLKLDMAAELRNLAHRVVEEYPGEAACAIPSNVEPTIQFLETRLARDGGAFPVRFVILNFLYRLAHFSQLSSSAAAAELHGVVWPHLERFVGLRLQDPLTFTDPALLRWEVTNACAIHDWDLATSLLDRLKSMKTIAEAECRALKGQMLICSVAAPRNQAEFDEELGVACRDNLDWWTLTQDHEFFPSGPFITRPLGLMAWGMDLADREGYSTSELIRLSDAGHEWEIAFPKGSNLLGSYRAAWAKAYFLAKDYLKAVGQFQHLLTSDCGMPNGMASLVRPRIYQSAAESYRMAGTEGSVESSVRLLEECAKEFPQTQGLWLKLADLYLSSPLNLNLERVRDCLRKEEEIDSSFGKDPQTAIALVLGELAADREVATLRRMAEPNPADLGFMRSVVAKHWPSFALLAEDNQKRWVGAARWLWGASTPSWERAALGRKVACTFPDIVEDLFARLFDRFRQEQGGTVLQRLGADSREEKFLRYLKGGVFGLGEMITEVDGTFRLPEPRYPELRAWLRRNARFLHQNWDAKRARRLNELRRSFSHPGSDMSEGDAVEVYALSVWFVDRLCGRN